MFCWHLEQVKWAGERELAEGGSGLVLVLLKCKNVIAVRYYEISCLKLCENVVENFLVL